VNATHNTILISTILIQTCTFMMFLSAKCIFGTLFYCVVL